MKFKPYIQLWGENVGRAYVQNAKKAMGAHPVTKPKKSSPASKKKSSSDDKTKKRRVRSIIRKTHSGVKNLPSASLLTRRTPNASLT